MGPTGLQEILGSMLAGTAKVGRLCLISAAVALMLIGTLRTVWNLLSFGHVPVDFAAYYVASELLLRGDAHLLYDLDAQNRLLAQVLAYPYLGSEGLDRPSYIYLPLWAAMLAPLALLPFPLAAYLWAGAGLLSIGAYSWILARLTRLPQGAGSWLAVAVVLLFFNPAQEALLLGQVTPLLALLVALAVYLSLEKVPRDAASGFLLGVSGGMKLFPAALGLVPALTGRWRAVAAMLAGLLGFVAAGLLVPHGAQLTLQYFAEVVPPMPHPWSPLNLSLGSTLGMALAGASYRVPVFSAGNVVQFQFSPLIPLQGAAGQVVWVASLLMIGLGLVATYRLRHDAPAAWMLWIVTLTAAVPLAWGHYFMLLPIALALLWRRRGAQGAGWWISVVLLGFALNRFYRPMIYFGVHPALTNLLALGPVLALWTAGLRQAFSAPGAPIADAEDL